MSYINTYLSIFRENEKIRASSIEDIFRSIYQLYQKVFRNQYEENKVMSENFTQKSVVAKFEAEAVFVSDPMYQLLND